MGMKFPSYVSLCFIPFLPFLYHFRNCFFFRYDYKRILQTVALLKQVVTDHQLAPQQFTG
jgi:hypothetical protein